MQFIDYSHRRGVLVHLLPTIHEIYAVNAQARGTTLLPPDHIITWTQEMGAVVIDPARRFLVCMQNQRLAGFLFYRLDGQNVYLEDVQIEQSFRRPAGPIMDGLIQKMEQDPTVKQSTVYAGYRIRRDTDTEIIASKSREPREQEWEKLGSFGKAMGMLKIRYAG
jgi:hypothetical protein